MWENNYIRLLFIALLMGLFVASTTAQQGSNNPFDLKSRVKTSNSEAKAQTEGNPFELNGANTSEVIEDSLPAASNNPFELNANQSASSPATTPTTTNNPFEIDQEATDNTPPPPPSNSNPFEIQSKIPKPEAPPTTTAPKEIAPTTPTAPSTFNDSNFIFWLMLFMLFLLTLLVSLFRQYISRAYRAFTNDNFLKLIHREQGRIIGWPYLSLYIGFVINAGIFALLTWKHFGLIGGGSMGYLFKFIVAVALIFIIKHLLLGIVASIFPVEKEIRQYSFMIVIFNIILGILLVPINISLAYGPESFRTILLFGALFVIFLIYLFRVFRSLFLASRYIGLHKFHFFMYLCTVEIAPVLVLTKLIMLEAGIQ